MRLLSEVSPFHPICRIFFDGRAQPDQPTTSENPNNAQTRPGEHATSKTNLVNTLDLSPGGNGEKQKDKDQNAQQKYFPAPKTLPGFPDAGKGIYSPKSDRKRSLLPDGSILEWDYQDGRVEKYDTTGKTHQGEFDLQIGN